MFRKTSVAAIGALMALSGLSVVACHGDFLTGGELSNSPNAPTTATMAQYFAGIQTSVWALLGSNAPRVTGIWVQQWHGQQSQYQAQNDQYQVDVNTTNGLHAGLYGPGGLVDIVKLEDLATAAKDSFFLGMARVQEGMTMGTGADLFGDLVYKQAVHGAKDPPVDPQLSVYDSVQAVLSAAITDLSATPSTINVGPQANDLVYGGDPVAWRTLAHTLKARFYLHTGEVDASAYAKALAEAQQGIMSDAGNYVGAFTAIAGQQNFYYAFNFVGSRQGYLVPNEYFDKLLEARNDPRRTRYFQLDVPADTAVQLSAARIAPDFQQPYVSYDENTLIWAEAAYRTGDEATALTKLNEERTHNGLPAESVSGQALLNEILIEKYIVDFQLGIEAWNDYKRTCTPNIVPPATAANSVTGGKVPARFFYDAGEVATDPNYAPPKTGNNGLRNANDPPNATSDGTGAPCHGQ